MSCTSIQQEPLPIPNVPSMPGRLRTPPLGVPNLPATLGRILH